MHFVRTEDLKTGMRLARPVYNKKSILLFDRNSLLSLQAIESIRNFGLIGVYVLEPAEPLPPLTQEEPGVRTVSDSGGQCHRRGTGSYPEDQKAEPYPVHRRYGHPQLRTLG